MFGDAPISGIESGTPIFWQKVERGIRWEFASSFRIHLFEGLNRLDNRFSSTGSGELQRHEQVRQKLAEKCVMSEQQIKGLSIFWACFGASVVIGFLQLGLRNDGKDPWADLLIRNGGVQYDLGDLAQSMDMVGEGLAMGDMVGVFLTLRAPEDAHDKIGKRREKAIQQLLLEILEVTDQQGGPFLLRKTQQ